MFFVPSNRCWLADGFRRGVRRGQNLVASLLAGANARNFLAFADLQKSFLMDRRFSENLPAFRKDFSPGVTEPTLVLVPCTKYRHGSAAPLAGLITLRPLHSLPHPLH
jgi:hypothetical protein